MKRTQVVTAIKWVVCPVKCADNKLHPMITKRNLCS